MSTQSWISNIRSIIILILLTSLFILFNLSSTSILPYPLITYSISKNISINEKLPLISRQINSTINHTLRLAVVSAIYNENYIKSVEVLGYSLRRINIQADLILFYMSNRLNHSILNRCRKAGWYLWPVERINPPRFAIIYPRFYDQYTKLRIWSLINYDRILYLDADTLVIQNIDELLTGTIYEDHQDGLLGAVVDVWEGQIGPNFNAGVLLIRPNKTIFDDMIIKMHNMAAYGSYWAEQGFLNWYFKANTARLPLIYNFNNVLAIYHRDIYSKIRNRIKIIHYTSDKPFYITQPNQLSNPAFRDLWNLWYQIHNDMNNRSFIL